CFNSRRVEPIRERNHDAQGYDEPDRWAQEIGVLVSCMVTAVQRHSLLSNHATTAAPSHPALRIPGNTATTPTPVPGQCVPVLVSAPQMRLFPAIDLVALSCFIGAWVAYAVAVEWSSHGRDTLNAHMDRYREVWMRRMLHREARMVDMQIMAALQNGTAFFASTSLIAIGGTLSRLRSPNDILAVMGTLPFSVPTSRVQWEAKTIGLVIIFAYAFFKFAWSYRLYNYVSILLGAMPFSTDKETPEALAHIRRTALLFQSAGRHFNRGPRRLLPRPRLPGLVRRPLRAEGHPPRRHRGAVAAAIRVAVAQGGDGERAGGSLGRVGPEATFRDRVAVSIGEEPLD